MKITRLFPILAAALTVLLHSANLLADDKTPGKPAEKPAAAAGEKKHQNIGPEAFDKMRKTDTNTVVLDVRTGEEFKAGHIPGAVLLDFNGEDFDAQLAKLDKSKTYLVHCASGGRSARASKKMEAKLFPKVFNLEGGMRAWEKAGKPVEKPAAK